ncbi:lipopolysaccharide biosynthesis protein [Vibrio sp. WXL210]|uniref:lipopolysaccharide biosynthesis protein n=1 Tax=Vibrio sp. WXL210 TaxID=3450709 RepID=UPI003EC76088
MIEKKFEEFKKLHNKSQLNNIEYLERQAKIIMLSDPELSKRIERRISNLERSRARKARKEQAVKSEQLALAVSEKKETDSEEQRFSSKVDKEESVVHTRESKFQKKIAVIRDSVFSIFVIIPIIVFSCYQFLIAAPRYESRTQLIVQQPDSATTMDAGMALLTGLGVSTSNVDAQLVVAYVYSNDMLKYLDDKLKVRDHYESNGDFFSRLPKQHSLEKFVEYFAKRVAVEVSEKSNIITVKAQGFSPEFSHRLANTIAARAEWYINSISHQLAEAQLEFIVNEHNRIEKRLKVAQSDLLAYQQKHGLINPEVESVALSNIAYRLESEIVKSKADLQALTNVMSEDAPQVIIAKNNMRALEKQLEEEKLRLTEHGENSLDEVLPVSKVLSQYAELKVELELAIKAYTSSSVSMEKSRIEAYRQIKYLVLVETATIPESNEYPRVFYNILLFAIIILLIFGIMRIVYLTVNELK